MESQQNVSFAKKLYNLAIQGALTSDTGGDKHKQKIADLKEIQTF